MKAEFHSEITAWLMQAGLAGESENAIVDGFCERCVAAGLPVGRAHVFIDTLHPVHEGRLFRWGHNPNETPLMEYGRTVPVPDSTAEDELAAERWRKSPFYRMLQTGDSLLRRENLRPMAVVSGRLEGRDLGGAVADIRSRLAALKLPVGYTYEIGGQYQAQGRAFQELVLVFAVAVGLVFLILVIQFRAWMPAIVILVAAPLSLGGALALLWLTGTDLNISSAMGLILLVGLVVKNGIMLLDFSESQHAAGEPFDTAIAHAGRVRLRPILMTTFCTLFGLLPLALGLGAGAELQRPLALAVIGGLTLSTPITLVVIPGLYAAVRVRRRRAS